MDIDQLLDAGRERRRETAETLIHRHERVSELTTELTTAHRNFVAAWDEAVSSGWTPAQLRQLGTTPPPEAWRPRKRIRKGASR